LVLILEGYYRLMDSDKVVLGSYCKLGNNLEGLARG
jgi:hypothetical protein